MQASTIMQKAEFTVSNAEWAKIMSDMWGSHVTKEAVKKMSEECYVHDGVCRKDAEVASKRSNFKSFIGNICKFLEVEELDISSVFGLEEVVESGAESSCVSKNEAKEIREKQGEEEKDEAAQEEEEEGKYECYQCWSTESEGAILLQKGCLCKGTNKTLICTICNLELWQNRKERMTREKEENSLQRVYKYPITCPECKRVLGDECVEQILTQWSTDISKRKDSGGENIDIVEEETYLAILEAEINQMMEFHHVEKMDKLIEKLKALNVEEGSEIMIQIKITKCLLYMGMWNGEKCCESSKELVDLLNDDKKTRNLDTNVRLYAKIQAYIYLCYSSLFFNISTKGKEQKLKFVWKKICESKKMLKGLQDEGLVVTKKIDVGTCEEQINNIEYRYYVEKGMFEEALKLGWKLLRDRAIYHGEYAKEYKDFFQNLIYLMWKDDSNMKLVQKSQVQFLKYCKWEEEDDRSRIINGLQMLCRSMNIHDFLEVGGTLEHVKGLYWYVDKMSDDYGINTFNCQIEVFFALSIIHGIMAIEEEYDESKSETMYGCVNTCLSELMWLAILYKQHETNNVLNIDNIFLTKRNLGHSLSKIAGMPNKFKEKRLTFALKLFREVYDEWLQYGEKSSILYEKIKKDRLLDVQLAEKNLETFKMLSSGQEVETRKQKLEKLRMRIKEKRK